MTGWLLPAAVLAVAMLEASVGHAGATGYIAVMGLLGVVLAFSALRLVTEVRRSRAAADLEGEEPVAVRRRSVSGLAAAAGGLVGSRLGEAVAAGEGVVAPRQPGTHAASRAAGPGLAYAPARTESGLSRALWGSGVRSRNRCQIVVDS